MRLITIVLLAGFLGCSAASAGEPNTKKELDKLQGIWELLSFTIDGQPCEYDLVAIKGNEISFIRFVGPKNEITRMLVRIAALSPNASPRAIDLLGRIGGDRILGIYDLKGDKLTFCYPTYVHEKDRPTEFTSNEGQTLLELKKLKE